MPASTLTSDHANLTTALNQNNERLALYYAQQLLAKLEELEDPEGETSLITLPATLRPLRQTALLRTTVDKIHKLAKLEVEA